MCVIGTDSKRICKVRTRQISEGVAMLVKEAEGFVCEIYCKCEDAHYDAI